MQQLDYTDDHVYPAIQNQHDLYKYINQKYDAENHDQKLVLLFLSVVKQYLYMLWCGEFIECSLAHFLLAKFYKSAWSSYTQKHTKDLV